MKSFQRVMLCFSLGILLQGSIYYYLDQIYLVPALDFEVTNTKGAADENGDFAHTSGLPGKAHYSGSKQYMALVDKDFVKIYKAGKPNDVLNVDLKGMQVSFFEWLPDRDLAIMALYKENGKVILAQFNPDQPDHEIDTELADLPRGSRIVDVAYSTATNVVYMKVRVGEDNYRVYRTDANYDTRRVYMQASNIGRIAVFFDEDQFFYDNVKTGEIYVFDGVKSGWRVINPVGRYRFIGLDNQKNIYIAEVNKNNEALGIKKGRLGVGFTEEISYDSLQEFDSITVEKAQQDLEALKNKSQSQEEKAVKVKKRN